MELEPTKEERMEELRDNLGISSLEHTFENFKPVRGTEKTLATFKSIALGRTKKTMLLCYGGVGSGKTHLCEATAIELYKRGLFCRVLTMARIMRSLKDTMNPGAHSSYDSVLEHYCSAQRLILDDVGMGGSGSDWEFGQLEEIVDFRYRQRLFTIMTTNRDLSELPDRVVSRFQDAEIGIIVLNESKDYRKVKGRT